MFPCLDRSGRNAEGEQSEFRRRSTIEFNTSSGSSPSGKPQPGVGSLQAGKEN